MSVIDQGFAIRRNGSCLTGVEVDCGQTIAPFHACCPTGNACPLQYNIACCPPGQNCTDAILSAPKPRCANATWDLFNNNGYFCCEHGQPGFDSGNSDGCAPPGFVFEAGDVQLSTISSGQTSTSSASPSSSSSSSTPVGAIVGGVIGGIAFLVLIIALGWFFLRRRKQKQNFGATNAEKRDHPEAEPLADKYRMDAEQGHVHEADGAAPVHEVDGAAKPPQEMPARTMTVNKSPVELPGATSPK